MGKEPRNRYGVTPLHRASCKSRVDVVVDLLQAHADIEARMADGDTALHWAAIHSPECLKVLLEAGARKEARNRKGQSALHLAAYMGVQESVDVLIKEGASKDLKDVDGMTPDELAMVHGN